MQDPRESDGGGRRVELDGVVDHALGDLQVGVVQQTPPPSGE
jgi:hypothetical protein